MEPGRLVMLWPTPFCAPGSFGILLTSVLGQVACGHSFALRLNVNMSLSLFQNLGFRSGRRRSSARLNSVMGLLGRVGWACGEASH